MTLRRAVFIFLTSILLVQPILAADWPMSRRDASQLGFTEESLKLPLRLAWQYNANKFPGNPSAPAVTGGVVYFASGDRIYAVDAETGALKWKYPDTQPLPNTVRSSPAVVDDIVYFGCGDGNLYAISALDGKFIWAFSTPAAIRSSPIVVGGTVFVGSDDDSFYAIDATTGENMWGLSGFRTHGDIPNAGAAVTGVLVFASMDLYVYGASQSTGKHLWTYRLTTAASKSSPVIAENTVYIGAGSIIYGLMLRSGLQKLGIPLPSEVVGSPAVADKDIYATCKDGKLYAYTISGRIAKPKWDPVDLTLVPTCGPTVAGNVVFVTGERGVVAAFSTEDGSLKWRYVITPSALGKTGNFTNASTPPVVADGRLYVLTDDGALHCFTSDAADSIPPDVFIISPAPAEEMCGSPPVQLSTIVYDTGCGVDPSSIQMLLDGVRVDHMYDMGNSTLVYETPVTQPIKALRDGRHVISATASDWLGNVKSQEWSFIVDKSLPPKIMPKAKVTMKKNERPPNDQARNRSQRPSAQPGQPGQQPRPSMRPSRGGVNQPNNEPLDPSGPPPPFPEMTNPNQGGGFAQPPGPPG